jgi:hypothetical protein
MLEGQPYAFEKLGNPKAAAVREMIFIPHHHNPEFFKHIVR